MNLYYEIMSRWQSFQLVSSAEMDRLLKRFNILFIYHSGKLENDQVTYQTTREIFETGTAAAFPEGSKTLFWQKNQKTLLRILTGKNSGPGRYGYQSPSGRPPDSDQRHI